VTRRHAPIRVLVIDDSASNRRAITQILESAPGVEVVDRASDGDEGLKKAEALAPDLITVDLEMPRLDGFTFLRLLRARRPTPVLVISSYAHRRDVFRALELGAVDFVAKPERGKGSLEAVRAELLEKVRLVRQLKPAPPPLPQARGRPVKGAPGEEPAIVAIGASTGGPQAVHRVLAALKGVRACVLIAQHMPALFTNAFAERLEQAVKQPVSEAQGGERVFAGGAYVAPGGRHLELVRQDGVLRLKVSAPQAADKHAPSVDRLFESVASSGARAHAVVLTGMGTDGAKGASAVAKAGGVVWAESDKTAVVAGMPQAAMKTGHVSFVLPLEELALELAKSLR
jgi:two-component system, chemotaxis family, protein-glutamate methylesterase/glutaminase